MLKYIALGAAVVVGGALALVRLRPGEYRVTRSARMAAPPAAVFPHLNDLKKFNVWNPWMKLDPGVQTTFSGAAAGIGASMAWAGNKNIGEGRMTVSESRPDALVRYDMEFIAPFAATAVAELALTPDGNGTVVTWSMTGQNTFMGKAMSLVMNMDRMMGGQFENGLASLRSLVESTASAAEARR
jgi:hypothetical protein